MSLDPEAVLLQRFLDGELAAIDAAAFEARLAGEPALRQRVDDQRALRAGFVAERAAGRRAPAGFTASVVAAARRLPSRQQIREEEVASTAMQFCRRLLLAAAILTVAALVFHVGLFERRASTVQATPDEVQQEMDRLDALVFGAPASGLGTPGSGTPGSGSGSGPRGK